MLKCYFKETSPKADRLTLTVVLSILPQFWGQTSRIESLKVTYHHFLISDQVQSLHINHPLCILRNPDQLQQVTCAKTNICLLLKNNSNPEAAQVCTDSMYISPVKRSSLIPLLLSCQSTV